MGKIEKLSVGTRLFFVIESICDRHLAEGGYHFEITSGKIDAVHVFDDSRKPEYRVPTVNRLGYGSCLEYPRCANLGKSFWLTYAEAISAADRLTDEHERKFGWMQKKPMRRPWRENRQPEYETGAQTSKY